MLQSVDVASAFSTHDDNKIIFTGPDLVRMPGDLSAGTMRGAGLSVGGSAFQINIMLRRSARDESYQRNEAGDGLLCSAQAHVLLLPKVSSFLVLPKRVGPPQGAISVPAIKPNYGLYKCILIVLSGARMSRLGLSARPIEVADLPQIQSIESSVYEDPWSANLLSQSLTAPMTHTLGFFQGDLCVAYSIYQVIFTEAHLLNIAVRKDSQRRGYGGELLDLVMLDSYRKGAISMFLEVRPSNRTAIELYKNRGFKTLMTREKYYSNGEAAFVMVKELSEVE